MEQHAVRRHECSACSTAVVVDSISTRCHWSLGILFCCFAFPYLNERDCPVDSHGRWTCLLSTTDLSRLSYHNETLTMSCNKQQLCDSLSFRYCAGLQLFSQLHPLKASDRALRLD